MARPLPPPEDCAHCGEPIPRHARACPGCGADERTGWRETSIYDGLDLPDDGTSGGGTPTGGPAGERQPVKIFWMLVGAGLLVLLIAGALGLRL